LATAGYDLAALTRDFLVKRVVNPCQVLEADFRHLARDGGLVEEVRDGCRGYAVAVRGIVTWHDSIRSVACEPLDVELARMKYHDGVLAALQAGCPDPVMAAGCVGGQCGA
jgi:hypothetical protein